MSAPGLLLVANYDNDVGYAWNNIYRLFNAIGRAFAARNVRPCVSFPAIHPPVTVLDNDIPWETLVFDARRASAGSLAQIKRAFRRLNIRYVYLTDQQPRRWDYGVLRTWGARRIVLHSRISVPNPHPAPTERGLRRLVKRTLAAAPLVNVDRIYTVSNFVRDRLVNKGCLPAARVKTILNGIDVDRWKCPARQRAASAPVVFFACSRAARYKGIPVLIEAASELRRHHSIENFRVRFAGDGPDLAQFKEIVAREGLERHFEFLGRLEGTRDEVCAADVIVVPSNYGDACPSTVSEGLASGRPVIATRAGGIPELVGDERNASLVLPGDVGALATAMARLATSETVRAELGRRGRQRAEQALRQDAYHQTVIAALLDDFGLT